VTDLRATMRREIITGRVERSPWLVPLIMAAIALAAQWHGLGSKPLWYDEVLTLKRAALPLSELVSDAFHNKHYPLYFLLSKPFASTDWTEAGLRLPACIFGAVSVFMAARIAGDLAGRWAAVSAGALMALSPIEVQYGQEARPYTLATAAILAAIWGLVRLLEPHHSLPRDGREQSLPAWLAYATGMIVALHSIGAAAPSFIAINIVVALLVGLRTLPVNWPMHRWLLVNLAVLVVWLPGLLALVLANTSDATRGLNWVPPMTRELAGTVLASLYMLQLSDLLTFERLAATVPLVGLGVALLAVAGGAKTVRSPVGTVLVTLTVVMPAALALVSLLKPMFVPRYLLWSTGPYFILAGVGITTLPVLVPRAAAALAIGCGAMASLWPYYAAETKPRWDLAAAYLAEHAGADDALVVSSGLARMMLRTYLARCHAEWPDPLRAQSRDEIRHAYSSGTNVWLVYGRAGQGGNLVSREEFTGRWSELGPARESVTFGRHIAISRHVKADATAINRINSRRPPCSSWNRSRRE